MITSWAGRYGTLRSNNHGAHDFWLENTVGGKRSNRTERAQVIAGTHHSPQETYDNNEQVNVIFLRTGDVGEGRFSRSNRVHHVEGGTQHPITIWNWPVQAPIIRNPPAANP